MLDLTINLIRRLIVYPENMLSNLNLTRGLIFSQTVLLKLVDKGLTREDAYKIVQNAAMDVWQDNTKNLKEELLNSEEVGKYLAANELNEIFDSKKILKNVEYIFNRSVFSDE
jgi:adenylosuccinate lyase